MDKEIEVHSGALKTQIFKLDINSETWLNILIKKE